MPSARGRRGVARPSGPSVDGRDAAQALDSTARALSAKFTLGLSPISLGLAFADWAWHLASAPGTAARLATAARTGLAGALSTPPGDASEALAADPRFRDEGWKQWPYSLLANVHLARQAWWDEALQVRGVERHHHDVVRLFARQWLDMQSPNNWLLSNPQVLEKTIATHGANLAQGVTHVRDDWRREHGLEPLEAVDPRFQPGVDVAVTPGQVVYRNHLVELIQYTPQTPRVQREPILIVGSWIMKYYILDLSPHNSMVRYLVSQGHTVFILSWRNPDEGDALLDMDDYLNLGVLDPLAEVTRLTGGVPIHAVGYCLGGTLLSIAAAALARPGGVKGAAEIAPFASLSLLAAQVDFREPGDLGILTDDAQVEMLEAMMAERGFLSGKQMAGSFQFLRSRELIWSTRMREYLLGERYAPIDLMAWNADTTRLPAVMHSEYLRSMYLRNDLAEGRYEVEGRPVSVSDVRVPTFVVGTVRDHVSPWHSVYKLHRLLGGDLTFVLTSGGHNAGIVSEPGRPRRHFQIHLTRADDPAMSPEAWQAKAEQHDGSWWPAWHAWLCDLSSGEVAARKLDTKHSLGAAPGSYVHVCYRD
ncbi:MAG: alpha/beta fold hydrolase [Burkholderiales bacterium]